MKERLATLALAAAMMAPLLVAAPGCSDRTSEYCDAYCDCEKCNDRRRDECTIDTDEQFDTASEYDCSSPAEAYADCVLDNSYCDGTNFVVNDVCSPLFADTLQCIADRSGRTGGGQVPGG